MQQNPGVLKISIASPLRRLFDYLPASELEFDALQPGMRLEVPFGHRTAVGLLVEKTDHSDFDYNKLKPVGEAIDDASLLSAELIELLKWVASYYHHPPGEVFFSALPTLLRKNKSLQACTQTTEQVWCLTPQGQTVDLTTLSRAPKQMALLEILREQGMGLNVQQLNAQLKNWRTAMKPLITKQLVETAELEFSQSAKMSDPSSSLESISQGSVVVSSRLQLNSAQQTAVDHILDNHHHFNACLLEGVTGSGKTEVYLQVIEQVIQQGKQALVLVPEIGLTPQMLSRFKDRFNCGIAVFHSGLNDKDRLAAWQMARDGDAPIIIGTRSAVFTPASRLGLIILDEEHDLSFKQQDGFRYSARDVAVKRAHQNNIPIVLGSATPSLECLHNAQMQRYSHLELPQRATGAQHPTMQLVDLRATKMPDGISPALYERMKVHLDKGNQVLLFLNRRGFAPTLLCHDCGWVSHCQRCDANMTIHRHDQKQRCHHCAAERPLPSCCPECAGEDLHPYGLGTERVEQALAGRFEDTEIIRMDRDTTRRKGAFEAMLGKITAGKRQILIGTQLLAKGHHFPNVTLVGVLNADNELFSSDFRATERLAQLIIQVAGRAGREEKPGEVLIQTHQPEHPLLQILIKDGYKKFAQTLLKERQEAELPPGHYQAMLRAEAVNAHFPHQFLQQAKQLSDKLNKNCVNLIGPLPAPMEKRAGRYRAQLLLQSDSRAALQILLKQWVPQLENIQVSRKVRWSLDVDPMESF